MPSVDAAMSMPLALKAARGAAVDAGFRETHDQFAALFAQHRVVIWNNMFVLLSMVSSDALSAPWSVRSSPCFAPCAIPTPHLMVVVRREALCIRPGSPGRRRNGITRFALDSTLCGNHTVESVVPPTRCVAGALVLSEACHAICQRSEVSVQGTAP